MTNGDPYGDNRSAVTGTSGSGSAGDGTAKGSSLNWPTVLASAGVAAVVSSLVVTIAVVGLVISGDIGNDESHAAAQTPTVVNLGSAQSELTTAAQAPVAAAAAAAATASPAAAAPAPAAPAAEQVPASDGGAGAGTAPIAQAPTQQQAPAAPQAAPTAAPAAAPQALTAGQLNTKVKTLMNTGASRTARADELQSGARGLGAVDGVANLLRISGAGFTYRMIAPVTVNGNSMTATLQMSLAGQGSRTRSLTWVWSGTKWKLTNKSTCDVAGLALLPCSL